MTQPKYVPALGHDALTRFYDPLIAVTLREKTLKGRLLDQAAIGRGHRVLDVGCGTGTLAILAKQRHPDAQVVGLDGDPKVLAIARAKIARAGVDVELHEGLAGPGAPFPPASFDRVVTSFVLHHLTTDDKRAAFAAIRGWLRPGGELHVLDFGPQANPVLALVARGLALLGGGDRVDDNWNGRLPALMREVGFGHVEETGRAFTPFGSASFYAARD
ncbi:MAG TPA: class I SAM-dependent methyltransferase [Myxococcota bacterium]|nr:class I SAM-dependent methyltransferase [Myxococcota bacterium]